MTNPIAAAIPPSVIRLKLNPANRIATRVTSTVTGMTTIAVSVVLQ